MIKTFICCDNCNKQFFRSYSRINRKGNNFCSKDCYEYYFKKPEVIKKRLKPEVIKKRFMDLVEIVDENIWLWKGYKNKWGYGRFSLNGEKVLAHRMSYKLFVGEIPEGICVCHKFDDPSNVCPKSLWLGTKAQNNKDRDAKGRRASQMGEKSGSPKLNNEKVLEIRNLYRIGAYTYIELANKFKVSRQNIQGIISRKYWKHI